MKKKLFLAMMAIVAVFATLTFGACSSDDDNNNGGGGSSSKVQKISAIVPVGLNQLDLFDVYVSVNGGQKVQLTKENTTEGVISETTDPTTGKVVSTTTGRVYNISSTTITSFPATYTVTEEIKAKEGVDFANQPNSDYVYGATIISEASSKLATIKTSFKLTGGVKWKTVVEKNRLDSYNRSVTTTVSFDANGNKI